MANATIVVDGAPIEIQAVQLKVKPAINVARLITLLRNVSINLIVRKPTKYSKKQVSPVSKQTCSEDHYTSDSDCDYLHAFDKKDQSRTPVTVNVNDHQCKLLVDTGASVNVLDEITYNSLPSATKLDKASAKIYPYHSHSPVEMLEKFQDTVETKNRITVATFCYKKYLWFNIGF